MLNWEANIREPGQAAKMCWPALHYNCGTELTTLVFAANELKIYTKCVLKVRDFFRR